MRHTSGAAALAAAALLVSACSSGVDDDGHGVDRDGSVVGTEQPTEQPTPDGGAATDAPGTPALGEARPLGPGVVAGAVPGGSLLWVTATDPDSDQMGCEGVPFDFLWVLDPATGERTRAFPDLPDDDQPFVTNLRVSPDDDGRVLFVSGCEGFLGRIDVGDVQPDGTVTDVTLLPRPDAELHGQSIRWNGPELIVGTGIEAYETPGLWLFDVGNGEWMDLDTEPYVDWVPLGDGLAAEVLFDQVRIVDEDGFVVDSLAANAVAPSTSGFPLLASEYADGANAGRVILMEEVGIQRVLDEFEGYGLGFSPDTRFATWTSQDPASDARSTTILELDTDVSLSIPDPWFAGITWLTDGIAYTSEGPDDEFGFGTPTVTVRSWTS